MKKNKETKVANNSNVENSVVEKKTAVKKTAEKPTAENSAAEKTAEKKTAKNSAVEKKTAVKKTAEKPTAEKKTAKNSAVEKKTAVKKTAEKPTAEKKTAKNSAAEKKTAKNSAAEKKTAVKKTAEKPTLADKVLETASTGKAKYMPSKFHSPKNKENKAAHIEACVALAEMSKKYEYPSIAQLVYFAIGKDAHKEVTFEKGYKVVNTEKAVRILNWCKEYAKHNGNPRLYTNGNVAHALTAFYERVSKKTKDFKAALAKTTPNAKAVKFAVIAANLGIESKSVVKELVMAEA